MISEKPIDIFSDGRACLSKNFRFVSQYLVHCNGVLNFFYLFHLQPELPSGLHCDPFACFLSVLFLVPLET